MFVNKQSNSSDIMSNIEGFDVFNSNQIFVLEYYGKSKYLMTKFEGRYDLVSNDIYNSYANYGLLYVVNRIHPNDLKVGTELQYPDSNLIVASKSSG